MSESPRADRVSTGGRGGEGGDGRKEKGRGREGRWWRGEVVERGEVEEKCCAVRGAGVLQLTNIRFMHFSSWLVLQLTFLMFTNIGE